MSYLVEWVSQLVLIVLFAVILELLLPTSGFQKYVKFVIGLVLIVALTDPIIRLFQLDPGDLISGMGQAGTDAQVEQETDRQKSEIESAQSAYIHEQVAVQMKDQVKEELNQKYGLQINDMKLSAKEADGRSLSLDKVSLVLGQANRSGKAGETGGRAVKPVEEVSVQLDEETKEEGKREEAGEMEKVRSFLAERWEIDKRLISIHLEGGD
ncbi:stage III sporulation protein AF [Sporolactobacillus sp. THM7-7]|nr:stage III sporulation protein AF [Sporolactobacillus sp. THM7-7]